MLVDPLLEKPVRDLQFNFVSFDGDKVNRFNPNVEILLTDPFFERIDHVRPYVFHGMNLGVAVCEMKAIYGTAKASPIKKILFIFNGLRISFHNVSTNVDK